MQRGFTQFMHTVSITSRIQSRYRSHICQTFPKKTKISFFFFEFSALTRSLLLKWPIKLQRVMVPSPVTVLNLHLPKNPSVQPVKRLFPTSHSVLLKFIEVPKRSRRIKLDILGSISDVGRVRYAYDEENLIDRD